MNSWRFTAPVYPGDTVTARQRVAAVRPGRQGAHGILTLSVQLLNQDGQVVQEGEIVALVRRVPDSASGSV